MDRAFRSGRAHIICDAELHVRSTVLWREGRWHCEAGRVTSGRAANLYVDDIIAAECVVDRLSPMLRTAHQWRMSVRSDDNPADLIQDLSS